jgi:UDP-glucose 4-epimerase
MVERSATKRQQARKKVGVCPKFPICYQKKDYEEGDNELFFTHIDDIINGLVLVGENGFGVEFGIGNPEMLPERKGNRMTVDVITTKTQFLGWKANKNIKDYIEEFRKNNWK